MEGFSGALDDILVSIYRNVLRLEKQMLKRSRHTTLSVSEVHLILCLGDAKSEGCTVTELARSLGITVSSATIAVSKLIQKGFVRKVRSQKDSRIVRVYLTETGKGVDTYNRHLPEADGGRHQPGPVGRGEEVRPAGHPAA